MRAMPRSSKPISHLLGLGLDHEDGHTRITRGDNFSLLGGSETTHEKMQETCIKLNEKIKQRGKTLGTVSRQELTDLFRELT